MTDIKTSPTGVVVMGLVINRIGPKSIVTGHSNSIQKTVEFDEYTDAIDWSIQFLEALVGNLRVMQAIVKGDSVVPTDISTETH